ncbi:hemin uptake protein HemP [Devosia sp.]|uniref:hemin uptake protein HemP n=1 Tax=Devosia sp. TaxID=1871048 RepID=UPI003BAC845A
MTEPSPPRPVPAEAKNEHAAADLDTRELFGRRSEIRISHDAAIYRLRITRAGKLILTK